MKSNSARSSSRGISVTTTASRVSRRTSVTFKGWKRAIRVGRSNALEIVERFQAVLAAIACLAGRRAELADLRRLGRAAARAGDSQIGPSDQLGDPAGDLAVGGRPVDRRRDAVVAQLFAALALIQSVVQGGESCRFRLIFSDALVSAAPPRCRG